MRARPWFGLLVVLAATCSHGPATGAAGSGADAGVDVAAAVDESDAFGGLIVPPEDSPPGGDGAPSSCGRDQIPRFTVALDAGDCLDRTTAPCGGQPEYTDSYKLELELRSILGRCSGTLSWMRASFAMGCPTRLELGGPNVDEKELSCVSQALASQRWSCALPLDCGYGELAILP
jgi:hypothetical protein